MAIVKKILKNKKKIEKKPSLKEIMDNILSIFVVYKIVYVNKYSSSLIVISFKNISSLQFF